MRFIPCPSQDFFLSEKNTPLEESGKQRRESQKSIGGHASNTSRHDDEDNGDDIKDNIDDQHLLGAILAILVSKTIAKDEADEGEEEGQDETDDLALKRFGGIAGRGGNVSLHRPFLFHMRILAAVRAETVGIIDESSTVGAVDLPILTRAAFRTKENIILDLGTALFARFHLFGPPTALSLDKTGLSFKEKETRNNLVITKAPSWRRAGLVRID